MALPGETLGPSQHGLYRVEQHAVPMLFQDAPDAFDRVVLVLDWPWRACDKVGSKLGSRAPDEDHRIRPVDA